MSNIVWILSITLWGGAYSGTDLLEIPFLSELECERSLTAVKLNNKPVKGNASIKIECQPKKVQTLGVKG